MEYKEPKRVEGKHRFMAGTCVDCGHPLDEICAANLQLIPDPTPPTETQVLHWGMIEGEVILRCPHGKRANRGCTECGPDAPLGDIEATARNYWAKPSAAPIERVETNLELELDLSQEIRLELWVNHQCQGKYGDDGEMQCNCFYPMIDFKRDFPSEILAKSLLHRIQLSRAAVAPSPAGEAQEENHERK